MKRFRVMHKGQSSGATYCLVVKSFATKQAAERFADRKNQEPMERTGGGFYSVEEVLA
jgi:hypothetical protein